MPQVLTDPSLNTGVVSNGGTDLFSYPNVQQGSVLGLQTPATLPVPPGTHTAVNLLSPPLQVASQLPNFPANIYDVSPTSMLYHFMQALLGDGGTGQLLRRSMITRLQQAITSTHFYDLDSFYGALFGAQRGPSSAIPDNPNTGQPVDPYGDLASPDGWDEVEAADAVFREQIIQLARAITLGGTMPGLQALAEAVTGSTCQVWEAWRLGVNAQAPVGNTWQQVTTTYATWSATIGQTWDALMGYVPFVNVNGLPSEVVIEPRKLYPSTPAGAAEQGGDLFGVLSVVEALRPAASMVSVVPGLTTLTPLPIASAWADSQNWELVHTVTPAGDLDAYSAVANSYQGVNASQLPAGSYVQPRPPLSRSAAGQYSYASEVTAVTARAVSGFSPGEVQVTDGQDFQVVVFPSRAVVQYPAAQAVMLAARALTGRAASSVAVKCAPYSGPRVPVAVHS